ncbi:MAG: conjugal transfer protein TraB [Desulfobacterales bacterium]|nr:conjugal transfer protein TraB [Desulfobacterales bacterium]MDX2510235.1 conjugal transfer protein TraB [Desulfobacterales bacterium]
MASMDEQVLRAAKEIVIKFIEGGRVSPAGFSETFKDIYSTVEETVKGSEENPGQKSQSGNKD